LPGRRSKPGNLQTLTIAEFADSVVADIEDAGLDDGALCSSMAFHVIDGVSRPAGSIRTLRVSRRRRCSAATYPTTSRGSPIASMLASCSLIG
jgi:hypothetical protein